MALSKDELNLARQHSEFELISILSELGAVVQFALSRVTNRPIGFQAFWPTGDGYDGRHEPYDARAHANVIP